MFVDVVYKELSGEEGRGHAMKRAALSVTAILLALGGKSDRPNRGNPQPPRPAGRRRPSTLPAYWVSVVTQDWRWPHGDARPKGDYPRHPDHGGGAQGGRHLGSGARRSGGRGVPRLRRARR
jgi:hypothetical protein